MELVKEIEFLGNGYLSMFAFANKVINESGKEYKFILFDFTIKRIETNRT